MDDEKIVQLPGSKRDEEETRKALIELRRSMDNGLPDMIDLMAQVTMIKYRAYLKAGFTAEQAMQMLCASEK